MNTILDPDALYISSSQWESEGDIAFVNDLSSLLTFIDSNKFTKIIWNDQFQLNLWDSPQLPPWSMTKSYFNKIVPILYTLINNNTIEHNFISTNIEHTLEPDLIHHYPESIYTYFKEALNSLNESQSRFFLYLGRNNTHFHTKQITINTRLTTTNLNCINICNITQWCYQDHVKEHCRNELRKKRWNPSKKHFPNIELCNSIEPSTDDYLNGVNNPSEKTALVIERGSVVAELNGYTYNHALSQKNSNASKIRKIYEAGSSTNHTYLSIDIKTGSFEICDYNGKHKGEWNFKGEKIDKADKSGGHDIVI
ncbi:hypothetical protein [Hymenobacter sp. B81]|uniref:hypothetical protein n=1 Tax=Hymenobacter sp. B81 TaxID=3344878 RepID=UPI0037DDA07C